MTRLGADSAEAFTVLPALPPNTVIVLLITPEKFAFARARVFDEPPARRNVCTPTTPAATTVPADVISNSSAPPLPVTASTAKRLVAENSKTSLPAPPFSVTLSAPPSAEALNVLPAPPPTTVIRLLLTPGKFPGPRVTVLAAPLASWN